MAAHVETWNERRKVRKADFGRRGRKTVAPTGGQTTAMQRLKTMGNRLWMASGIPNKKGPAPKGFQAATLEAMTAETSSAQRRGAIFSNERIDLSESVPGHSRRAAIIRRKMSSGSRRRVQRERHLTEPRRQESYQRLS